MMSHQFLLNEVTLNKQFIVISYSTEILGFLAFKYHPETSLNLAWQHWLGIAKPKKGLQINPKPFHPVAMKFFIQ